MIIYIIGVKSRWNIKLDKADLINVSSLSKIPYSLSWPVQKTDGSYTMTVNYYKHYQAIAAAVLLIP